MSLDIFLYADIDTGGEKLHRVTIYDTNITHNLGEMAEEAGIYEYLWRPEEVGCKLAGEIIVPVEKGLAKMKADPEHYKKFNSPNGWGVYENFIPWVENLLTACKAHPKTRILACR